MNVYQISPLIQNGEINPLFKSPNPSSSLILAKAIIRSKRVSITGNSITLYGNFTFPNTFSQTILSEVITDMNYSRLDNTGLKASARKGQGFIAVRLIEWDDPETTVEDLKQKAHSFHSTCKIDASSSKLFMIPFYSFNEAQSGEVINVLSIVIGEVGESKSDFYTPFSGLDASELALFDKTQASIPGFQVSGLDAVLGGPVSNPSWGPLTAQTANLNPNNAPNFGANYFDSTNPFNP